MTKTKVLAINADNPDRNLIGFGARLLAKGALVAFPTETVYGIGANLLNRSAVKRLYEIKKRPGDKPFTVHISSLASVGRMGCEIPEAARQVINEFWPGPLTIILKSKSGTVGFRMPENSIAKLLIEESGVPVAAPSANISGAQPAVTADEVVRVMGGKVDLVIDGGPAKISKESTIVDFSTPHNFKILRQGAVPAEDIKRLCGDIEV